MSVSTLPLNVRLTILCLAGLALGAGCTPAPGGTITSYVNLPGDSGQCLGLVNHKLRFSENGRGEVKYPNADFTLLEIMSRKIDEIFTKIPSEIGEYHIGWNQKNFVPQADPKLCWAAALTMALRHGQFFSYDQRQFSEVNRNICHSTQASSATLDQLVFSLTAVHINQGIWISDRRGQLRAYSAGRFPMWPIPFSLIPGLPMVHAFGAPPVPPPVADNFNTPVTWWRPLSDNRIFTGGVFPVTDNSDLLHYIANKVPIVAGLEIDGNMHVVVIIATWARPGGMMQPNGVINLERGATRIETIGFVDPSGSGAMTIMPFDEFVQAYRFAFALIA